MREAGKLRDGDRRKWRDRWGPRQAEVGTGLWVWSAALYLRAGCRGPGRGAPGSPAQARRRSGRSTGGGLAGGGGGNPPPTRNCLLRGGGREKEADAAGPSDPSADARFSSGEPTPSPPKAPPKTCPQLLLRLPPGTHQSRCRCWETHLRGWRGGEASLALGALGGPCPPRRGPGRSVRWLASPVKAD